MLVRLARELQTELLAMAKTYRWFRYCLSHTSSVIASAEFKLPVDPVSYFLLYHAARADQIAIQVSMLLPRRSFHSTP